MALYCACIGSNHYHSRYNPDHRFTQERENVVKNNEKLYHGIDKVFLVKSKKWRNAHRVQ